MKLVNQPTNRPNRKVQFATFAASLASLIMLVVTKFFPVIMVIPGVHAQLTDLLTIAIVGLITFVVGYFTRERAPVEDI